MKLCIFTAKPRDEGHQSVAEFEDELGEDADETGTSEAGPSEAGPSDSPDDVPGLSVFGQTEIPSWDMSCSQDTWSIPSCWSQPISRVRLPPQEFVERSAWPRMAVSKNT